MQAITVSKSLIMPPVIPSIASMILHPRCSALSAIAYRIGLLVKYSGAERVVSDNYVIESTYGYFPEWQKTFGPVVFHWLDNCDLYDTEHSLFNSQFTFLYFKRLFNNYQILHVPNQVKEHHQLPSDSIPSPTVHTISFFALSVWDKFVWLFSMVKNKVIFILTSRVLSCCQSMELLYIQILSPQKARNWEKIMILNSWSGPNRFLKQLKWGSVQKTLKKNCKVWIIFLHSQLLKTLWSMFLVHLVMRPKNLKIKVIWMMQQFRISPQ